MNPRIQSFRRKIVKNGIPIILSTSFAILAASRLIDSMSSAHSRNAYARQVDYRLSH